MLRNEEDLKGTIKLTDIEFLSAHWAYSDTLSVCFLN